MKEIPRRTVALVVIIVVVVATVAVAAQVAATAGDFTGRMLVEHGPAWLFEEDGPLFDCRYMGNRLCGPGNDQGAVPGCYVGGELVAPWRDGQVPCVPRR